MDNLEKLYKRFVSPQTPFEAYPFDCIEDSDFRELIDVAIEQQRITIEEIVANPNEPTFNNTSLALEESGSELNALLGAFYNLLSANGSDTLMEIAEEIAPKLSQLSNDILLSVPLFNRIKKLYNDKEALSLSTEEHRLLFRQYESFTRNGGLLNEDKKQLLRETNSALSLATLTFGNNMLKSQKQYRYYIPISQSEELRNIPQGVLEFAQKRAMAERGLDGYLFTLDAPEYVAIMKYAHGAELRKKFYLAKMRVAYSNDVYNNEYLIRRIVNLRLKKAKLLGFNSYAEYVLATKMLNTPEKVWNLLNDLQQASRCKATAELAELEQIKGDKLNPWDVNYYFEKLCDKCYSFSEKELQPYFPLTSTIKGVLGLAERLYGLSFTPQYDISTYNDEVKVYRVDDNTEKGYIGLLYLDFFPREGKRSGAWMNNLREQSAKKRPHILLVMNFSRPRDGEEALLLPSEVHTFLHEFGHALHGLLSQARFESLSGTNVTHDFVELPSQINENWLTEPEFLNGFARHYKTDEPIPANLLEKFIQSSRYRTGYDTQRQLAFGFLDMMWHSRNIPLGDTDSLEQIESEAFEKASAFGSLPKGCLMSASFSHLFNGGYAAGYYGYKWSEVLSCDAFSCFKERGVFDAETASRFRKNILEKGDTEDAEILYQRYREKGPTVDALKQRDGF